MSPWPLLVFRAVVHHQRHIHTIRARRRRHLVTINNYFVDHECLRNAIESVLQWLGKFIHRIRFTMFYGHRRCGAEGMPVGTGMWTRDNELKMYRPRTDGVTKYFHILWKPHELWAWKNALVVRQPTCPVRPFWPEQPVLYRTTHYRSRTGVAATTKYV